jgi:hypothetical protein
VDYFVILESKVSFQNSLKPLHYKENAKRFAKFKDKIIHVPIKDMEAPSSYYR